MAQLANKWGPQGIYYSDGRPAVSALATVRNSTSLSLASIFTDKTKQFLGPNPLTTDIYGNLGFFVDPGEYLIEVAGYSLEVVVGLHPADVANSGATSVTYVHAQLSPSVLWQIPHGQGRKPVAVLVKPLGGGTDLIEYSQIDWPSDNLLELRFGNPGVGTPVAGYAYI